MIKHDCAYLNNNTPRKEYYCHEKERFVLSCDNCRFYLSSDEAKVKIKQLKDLEVITCEDE